MFCIQCEQTARGAGCTTRGVCGKTPEVAALQDLLIHALKGLSLYTREGRKHGVISRKADRFAAEALFSTLTNVNFDAARFQDYISRAVSFREQEKEKVRRAGGRVEWEDPSVNFTPASDLAGLIRQGEAVGLPINHAADEDVRSLQLTALYGLKGISAYTYHAAVLGREDERIYNFIGSTLAALADPDPTFEGWLERVLRCGEINLLAMELLDAANTGHFGHPQPTTVPLGHKKGKAILVSGHDLKDLEALLQQTEGKGIYVYTHGEMLPAHGYPALKKYSHLYGHFGTAWQNQRKQLPDFPGAILFTTNCLQEPQDSYRDNVFTTGPVGWPGVKHVAHGEFDPVIEKALALPGFAEDEDKGSVTVGFAHQTVLGVADKLIDAIKSGAIKHIFLVGGCDGAKPGRNYYTEFVEKTPPDSLVLTLACGKFRFFDRDLGKIGELPRLLDMGQCNDAYSAIKVASALAKAFDCSVNDLPLTLNISWYEQKAVAVLLTLLHLGIKKIRLGPTLPAFLSKRVLDTLVEKFEIRTISNAADDLAASIQG